MSKHFSFELNKTKKTTLVVMCVTTATQLIALYFFTIIARFEPSSTEDILKNYSGLIGLATTITMFVSVIYGTIVANRIIVANYIGDSRMRLYLYPHGRSQLYYTKNMVFVSSFSFMQLLGILIANITYVAIESLFPIMISQSAAFSYLLDFLTSSVICTMLTTSMILLSSFVGIRLSSPVATIVTAIILIVCCGNLMAMAFANYQLLTLILTVVIAALVFAGVVIAGARINKDEVF